VLEGYRSLPSPVTATEPTMPARRLLELTYTTIVRICYSSVEIFGEPGDYEASSGGQ
jgi:hypothetical protein